MHLSVDADLLQKIELNLQPFTLLGLALAIFLGFRINVSHERYWDARKLWGTIMNASRALARQALTLTEWAPKSPEAQRFVRSLIAHAHAFRHQLRHTDARDDLQRLLIADDLPRVLAARWKPVVIQQLLGDQLHVARRDGSLPDVLAASMEQSFNTLGDAIGGCERIAGTPIPLTFSVMVHRTIYFYCTLLPFALVGTIGWYTPTFAVFVAYTFMALEAIAEELEAPFGFDDNDLALEAICANRVAREVGRLTYTQLLNSRGGIEADLTEDKLARVKVGAAATVTVNAYPNERFSGRVTYVASMLDKDSRTTPARI